jgi:hypothetical protein
MKKIIYYYSKYNKNSIEYKNELERLFINNQKFIEYKETTENYINIYKFDIKNVPSLLIIENEKIIYYMEKENIDFNVIKEIIKENNKIFNKIRIFFKH